MKNFEYVEPRDVRAAAAMLGDNWNGTRIMGGGTDLLDEMKERIIEPDRIVHLHALPLNYIRSSRDGVHIGALTTIATLEADPTIAKALPGLSEAAAVIATPQIRNAGTVGGNLCQRPRCWYFRNVEFHCLKKGGDVCFAMAGDNKYNAILGGGPSFIVHPSDLAPMLMALDGSVRIASARGERVVPLSQFFTLPTVDVHRENILQPNEFITEVMVPHPVAGSHSTYLKIKERDTQDFALVSAAVSLTMAGGVIRTARVVMGGVAPIPWHSPDAEAALKGKKPTPEAARAAAEAALAKAQPLEDNAYKVPLATTAVRRAILAAAGVTG